MSTFEYLIIITAGIAAGIVNTLAGSGSLFTLSTLLFLGLPAHLANGTNRIGVLFQTLIGAATLYKKGNVKIKNDLNQIIPAVVGSVVGATIAVEIPESTLKLTIGILMLLLLVVLMSNFNQLSRDHEGEAKRVSNWVSWPLMFLIGCYGGFIQLGVGIFSLAAFLLLFKFSFKHANALKNIVNFFLTVPAFIIFAFNHQVDWQIGILMAVGQALGAWLAARYATENANAGKVIRILLIAMTLYSAFELLGIKKLLFN